MIRCCRLGAFVHLNGAAEQVSAILCEDAAMADAAHCLAAMKENVEIRPFAGEIPMRNTFLAAISAITVAILNAGPAGAGVVQVLGTAGPWDDSINTSYEYGDGAQTAPTEVGVTAGVTYTIQYVSGLTCTAPGAGCGVDANGYTGFPPLTGGAPGQYTSTAPYLNELVGTYATAGGAIIGTPFVVGDGPVHQLAPAGARELLLGINDNQYSDNSGALQVSVAVPEPATWAMILIGAGMIGAGLRLARRKDDIALTAV
jgi:hypothetical protein